MLVEGAVRGSSAPLIDHLRSATRAAHMELETTLQLLEPPLSCLRFARALTGFQSFHRVWEPKVEALLGEPDMLVPRRKLALIAADLDALGHAGNEPISFDLDFLDGAAQAWGSLYVLEGSTLGGQVISRSLKATDWAPPNGLAYFNPYGRRIGAMWTQFRTALEARAPGLDPRAVVDGACATFRSLKDGLVACGGVPV